MRLLLAMVVVTSAVTALALYFAQERLAANVEQDLRRQFEAEVAALDHAQSVRHAALLERCRALVRNARIRAALEEDITLLYPNAENELRDLINPAADDAGPGRSVLQAEFYRFLDAQGAVIRPPQARNVGMLLPEEEARLALRAAPPRQQVGYLRRQSTSGGPTISEIIAMPIVSTDTGEVMAALVLGFAPFEFGARRANSGLKSGVLVDGRLDFAGLEFPEPPEVEAEIKWAVARPPAPGESRRISIHGIPHLLFHKHLNPDSAYPPAHEVCVFSLSGLLERQAQLRWQVLGAGGLLFLLGLAASHVVASRLSAPVEKLAVDSEQDRADRQRAEHALELTSAELQRSARFSADASHQLKTPVTVLRAGLEELLSRENLTPEECHEVSALIHQTYRLSSLIEDLLLLSRMDAGRLKLQLQPVNLSQLIEASLDDMSALPDEFNVRFETNFPPDLHILGEKRYTAIILQNLLENARKYNYGGGTVGITAKSVDGEVILTVGNTGQPIPPRAQAQIFERFHRGGMGENVPGYGLGLNLARELARLHQGDLRLVRSDATWTEFELRFRLATAAVP